MNHDLTDDNVAQWPETDECILTGERSPDCEGCSENGCARGEHILAHRQPASENHPGREGCMCKACRDYRLGETLGFGHVPAPEWTQDEVE